MQSEKKILIVLILLSCFSLIGNTQNRLLTHGLKSLQRHQTSQSLNKQHFTTVTSKMQWASIETNQNEFDWNESDYLYDMAKRNDLAFTWSINLDVEYQPEWIKNAERFSVKERLLHFIDKICERYEAVAQITLEGKDIKYANSLTGEISKNCKNTKITISQIQNANSELLVNKINLKSEPIKSNNQIQSNQNNQANVNDLSEINKNVKNSRLLQGLPQPLTANFNAGSIIGYTVSVSSLAETTNSATISSIEWDWGDDSDDSITQNAVHIYEYSGTYTITLTVTDSAGNTAERTSEVTVPADNMPAPSFTNSNAKKAVTFNASLSISKYAPITLLIWNFGDGNITRVTTSGANMLQSEVVIVHTYAQSIAYNVTLTVIDDRDAEGTIRREISVTDNEQPIADFKVVNVFGNLVNVESNCTDSDGYVADYRWIWGDGSEDGQSPSAAHIYENPGTYVIQLIAIDDDGAESVEKNVSIIIPQNNPLVNFTHSVAKRVVQFNASRSVSPTASIQSYKWDFGDGNVTTTAERTIAHTYATAATFDVILQVTDSQNLKGTSQTVEVTTIANIPPTTGFTYKVTGRVITVTSATTDPDSTEFSYQWNFGQGEPNGTDEATTTYTYLTTGTFNVTLRVLDEQGSPSAIVNETVLINDPPVSAFTYTKAYLVVDFDGSGSSDDTEVTAYRWNFNDSLPEETTQTVTHTFLAAGTYNVKLTVTDNLGLTHITTQQVVVVANTPPVAQFTTTQADLTVTVDATQSRDDSRIESYSWNWGDGSAVDQGLTQTHTYLAGGNYQITLTVTDPQDLADTATRTVNVQPPNVAPVARYSYTTSGLRINVDGRSSSDDNRITSYQWNWGDNTPFGTRSTDTHNYIGVGTYTVVLTVSDAQNLMSSTSQTITIPATNNPPTAAFSSSMIGRTLTVNAAASTDDIGIVSYRWDWGDTQTDTETVSTKTHTYTAAGTYTVTLTVSDLQGLTATATDRIRTNNR